MIIYVGDLVSLRHTTRAIYSYDGFVRAPHNKFIYHSVNDLFLILDNNQRNCMYKVYVDCKVRYINYSYFETKDVIIVNRVNDVIVCDSAKLMK